MSSGSTHPDFPVVENVPTVLGAAALEDGVDLGLRLPVGVPLPLALGGERDPDAVAVEGRPHPLRLDVGLGAVLELNEPEPLGRDREHALGRVRRRRVVADAPALLGRHLAAVTEVVDDREERLVPALVLDVQVPRELLGPVGVVLVPGEVGEDLGAEGVGVLVGHVGGAGWGETPVLPPRPAPGP